MHEHVTWKQRQFDFFAAVFPPVHRAIEWKEALQPPEFHLLTHAVFVTRTGIDRIPVRWWMRLHFTIRVRYCGCGFEFHYLRSWHSFATSVTYRFCRSQRHKFRMTL